MTEINKNGLFYGIEIETGSDFSGVGAFDQALSRLGIKQKKMFACDWDKYSRQTYILNYGEPDYFPEDVYDRKIPESPLGIYMTSPPCQAFSMAGKRGGEDDKRGILFYNSHEFIDKNRPRYFIFENVAGLLSHDKGRTFQKWIEYLGGNPVLFPHDESVPYHIYHFQMNARKHGVPQNRPRVFIVGIRDDADNNFSFPKKEPLIKKLRDCLEENVDEKYFLSEKMIRGLMVSKSEQEAKGNGFGFETKTGSEPYANSITTKSGSRATDNFILIKSNTKQGFEFMTEEDSLNLAVVVSETRRGRVGKGVAQTLDTTCNQGVLVANVSRSDEGKKARSENMKKGKDYTPFQSKKVEFVESDTMNCISTALSKDNLIMDLRVGDTDPVIIHNIYGGFKESEHREFDKYSPTIRTPSGGGALPSLMFQNRVRRLTPRECFRFMDFPDSFIWDVSDTQAYKQAGNSIPVRMLVKIIEKLNLK